MWKSGYTKHLEAEVVRLRAEIARYRIENGRLVDRLLTKSAIAPIQEETPTGTLTDRGGLFDDEEEEEASSDPFRDNRKGVDELVG